MSSSGFVDVDHTADWAIRIQGADLADLLGQAAAGLLTLANPVPLAGRPGVHHEIRLRADDPETLLVRWLEELHFLLETQGQIPRSIRLSISPDLALLAHLEVSPAKTLGRPIKAITFHGLRVVETAGGLEATVVFDV